MAITYNTTKANLSYIYRASSGGTVFSTNLATTTAFDIFTDTAVVNDAIYFGVNVYYTAFSNLYVNVGTPITATGLTFVWEYYRNYDGWIPMHNLTDNTNGFTTTGANTIVFPMQAHSQGVSLNVNGIVGAGWVRCRITAVTSISEGGATQTSLVQRSDGILNTGTDYTIGSPCTLEILYQWCLSNAPELSVTKIGNNVAGASYFFPHCSMYFSSYTVSKNENLYIGNGHGGIRVALGYLVSGTLFGTYNAYESSNIFFCINLGTAVINGNANTKMYGGIIKHFYYEDGRTRVGLSGGVSYGDGTFIQVQVMCPFSGYFGANAVLKNISATGELTTTSFATSATALDRVTIFAGKITLFTPVNGTMVNLSLYPASNTCMTFSTNLGNQKIYFINPLTPFPAHTPSTILTNSFINRGATTPANIAKVLFYDDSSATFTDYTTQAQSATTNDVPLYGDVNDILYFLVTGSSAAVAGCLYFDLALNASNDYVYQWQIYTTAGSWENAQIVWDATNNFTTTDNYIHVKNSISTGADGSNKRDAASVTINGTAGFWIRAKIITKGTGTPTASRIKGSGEAGVSDWNYFQQFYYDLKVQDIDKTPISGATVTIKDTFGTLISTVTTDANGNIAQQTITEKKWFFDPIASKTNFQKIGTTIYSPLTITVSKSGYETAQKNVDISSSVNDNISLKPIVPIRLLAGDGASLALEPEKGSSSLLKKI